MKLDRPGDQPQAGVAIEIELWSDVASEACLDPVIRFRAPAVVLPVVRVAADDGAGAAIVRIECFLNGRPFAHGLPIRDPGVHHFAVVAHAADGGASIGSVGFEIASLPCVAVAASRVESLPLAGGGVGLHLSIEIDGGDQVDAQIVAVIMIDSENDRLESTAFSVIGSRRRGELLEFLIGLESGRGVAPGAEVFITGVIGPIDAPESQWLLLAPVAPATSPEPPPIRRSPGDAGGGSGGADGPTVSPWQPPILVPGPEDACGALCDCRLIRCETAVRCEDERCKTGCSEAWAACTGNCASPCLNGTAGFYCEARCWSCDILTQSCGTICRTLLLLKLAECQRVWVLCKAGCFLGYDPGVCIEDDPILECR
ncbi:MAG TPA: hypothetical protein PKC43_03865 [Phycisphaerales bacterium]|nr:hypothetical protein [Phycisphaerales bacterium]HMP36563.1 hypothetical protein [Phycisphaerales bacterium]